MKINETIHARRKSLRMTQKELAEKINVRNSTISDVERGKHAPMSDTLDEILEILQLSILPDDCVV